MQKLSLILFIMEVANNNTYPLFEERLKRYTNTMIVLLHSSKTMRIVSHKKTQVITKPLLKHKTKALAGYLKTLSTTQLGETMHLSSALADKTHALLTSWTDSTGKQSLAIDTFIGDIYSGLHASDLSEKDRDYANRVLFILSGLYGCIRPYDGIYPYRLEMGYKLPDEPYSNVYRYWGKDIVACLPASGIIVNLAALEYAKTILPYIDAERIIEPKFLTINPRTGEPTFVVVHAKIARGAFARWLIVNRVKQKEQCIEFQELGYMYDKKMSKPKIPVFVCKEFKGKGLSIRLSNK